MPDAVIPYLEEWLFTMPSISVVGIAGPGDPLADAETTLQICRSVHLHFPEKLLCLSTNGLSFAQYAADCADAGVTHITITVNAVRPDIGSLIYEWIAAEDGVRHGLIGAAQLLEAQMRSIAAAKEKGLTVKVNTVVINGINEGHVPEVARTVAAAGADVMNCIPMIPVSDTPFGCLPEISRSRMIQIADSAAQYIRQVRHCVRCRADAAGFLCHSRKESYRSPLKTNTAAVY